RLQEQRQRLCVVDGRPMQRRQPLGVQCIRVGPGGEQQPDHLGIPAARSRFEERRRALPIPGVGIRALRQKQLDQFWGAGDQSFALSDRGPPTGRGRGMKRRTESPTAPTHLHAALDVLNGPLDLSMDDRPGNPVGILRRRRSNRQSNHEDHEDPEGEGNRRSQHDQQDAGPSRHLALFIHGAWRITSARAGLAADQVPEVVAVLVALHGLLDLEAARARHQRQRKQCRTCRTCVALPNGPNGEEVQSPSFRPCRRGSPFAPSREIPPNTSSLGIRRGGVKKRRFQHLRSSRTMGLAWRGMAEETGTKEKRMIEALLVIVGVLLALPYLIAGMFWLAAATNGPRHRREAEMRKAEYEKYQLEHDDRQRFCCEYDKIAYTSFKSIGPKRLTFCSTGS